MRHASWNPYPISDQNLWFSLPYFRPEALEPCAWPERVTSCYGTYTVGVNIIWGNGLIAKWWRSSFFEKTYPIQDQSAQTIPHFRPKRLKKNHTLWRRKYLYSLHKGVTPPPGAKNALQIMSLAAYASETNQWMRLSILWRIKEIEAEADNTLWDVHNSVYDTKADYYSFKIIPSLKT